MYFMGAFVAWLMLTSFLQETEVFTDNILINALIPFVVVAAIFLMIIFGA